MAVTDTPEAVPDQPIQPTTPITPNASKVDPTMAKYEAALSGVGIGPGPGKTTTAKGAGKQLTLDDYTKAIEGSDPVSPMLDGTVGQQDPTKYPFQMKPGLDNDLLRAQNQSWEKQVGLGLANIVPNIVTGIGESVGQLGTLMQFGDDRTYSNALTETMQEWHNPFGEIYAEHPNAVADLSDSAWWISNASSLVEMAGQFAALGDGLGSLFEKGAMAAGDLLGSANATKALLGVGQVATSAALSYTIGASMGAQVYQQAYQTNYNRLRSSGLSHDESDTQAKHVASQAAASTVQLNTALGFGLNLTSVLPVFKQSDEVIDFLRDGEGAIKPGETPEAYKSRLQSLGQDSPELKKVTGQQTLGDHLIEGGKQAAEMAVMHWAKQSGIREGNSGQTEGFLQQFDQLGNLLGDVTSSQGIMNAILGVAGGVLNTTVLERIPMHRDFVRQGGDNVPVMNEDGTPKTDEDGSPIYQTKLYNSRDFSRNQRMAYFENARDAVVSDLTHISSKLDNLKSLSASGKTIEMQSEMNDLLAVQQLHSITMGLGENLVGQYQEISATDNHTDLGMEASKQASDITVQQFQLLQQNGMQEGDYSDPEKVKQLVDNMPPEIRSQYEQLDQQRKQLLTQSVSLSGVSEAMQKGFTTSMKDNSYKERADQASKDILTYQKWHQDLTRTFGFDPRNAEAHVPEMVLHKMIQSNLYQRLISKLDTDNGTQRLEMAAQSGPVLSTDNFNSIVQDWNRKVSQNSRVGNSFNEDIKALHKAVQDQNGPVVEGMLAKYKIDYPQGDHATGINELTRKLADLRDTKWQQSKDAEKALGESLEYQAWKDKGNGDKSLPDYIAELNKRTLTNDLLSQKEEYTEQLRGEHKILNDQINDIKSKPRKYAKSVLQDYDDAQKKLNNRVKAENQTFFDKDRENQAADNVTVKQKQAALKVYHTKVSDLDDQISQREEALKGMVGKETSKLGRLISWVKDPQEKSTRQEIANLQAQRDFFRDKIASIILPSDTPEQAESEGELTAIPDHIAELVNSQAGQINSQLSPDQIRTQIGKVLQNEGIDISTITPESIDALTIRALASNKTASEHDNSETLNTLDDLINSTGNPGLVKETIDNILDEKEPFSYDALKMHQLMGFVDQPTAAKIMDHVNDLINGSAKVTDVNTSTPPEPAPEDTPSPEPDVTLSQDTPDPDDTSIEPPDDPTPAPDAPSDLPAAGRNIQLGGKPMFHVGSQSVSALKINRLDIAYQTDVVNENEYKMRSMSSLINRTLSDQMLQFGKIKVGDKVTLTVDKEWKGNRNIDTTPNSQTADSSDLYFDKNGKIPLAQGLINEVPIKITVNGETQGYLPRMGWVLAKYEGAENYRNIATQVDEHGNVINDAEMQAERLAAVREHVVKFFNSGSKDIETTIMDRTPAHLIMNVDEKGTLDPKPAKDMLPDKSLELGIVDNGLVKTSKTTTSDKELGMTANDSQWMSQGAPVAVVPMPNGKFATASLLNRSIEQHEITTMLQLIKSYLTGDGKIQAKVKELTGFDISNAAELRNLINQHYTYTQRFAKSVLQTSMSEDATPRFMFNITNEAGHQKSEISVGTAYSGRDKMVASMTNDGQLHPEFVRQFTEGMKGRFKNIVFEDNQRGLKGLNSEGKINEIVATKAGIKLRATHDSYNDYVKSFSDSPVNGTNTLSTGEHVYGVHSNTTLDMQGIMESRPDGKESAVAKPLTGAEIPLPSSTETPSETLARLQKQLSDAKYWDPISGINSAQGELDRFVKENPSLAKTPEPPKPNFSQDDADLLGEGFMDSLPNFDKPGLTLESLRDLHTFTPDEEHNGRTPQEVLAELQKMGITKLPPNFNPFKEC